MQIVDWAAAAMLAGIVLLPLAGLVIAYLFRRMEHTEKLRAIERGVSLACDPIEIQLRTRRAGLTLIGLGLGTMAGSLLAATKLGSHMISGIGLGCIPFITGVALLIDYRLQRRAHQKHETAQ